MNAPLVLRNKIVVSFICRMTHTIYVTVPIEHDADAYLSYSTEFQQLTATRVEQTFNYLVAEGFIENQVAKSDWLFNVAVVRLPASYGQS